MTVLRWILRHVLPADVRDAVLADLETEYATSIRPARGWLSARWWYWRQLAGSVGPALAMRRRRRARSGISMLAMLRRTCAEGSQDLRFALRMLARNRTFTAAAIGTFAIGIGMTTAVFSLVDAILLRPLPYAEPSRLVRIWSANPRGIARNMMSPADFFDLRDAAHGFDALAAFTSGETLTLSSAGDPTRITGTAVTPNVFDVLGVAPIAGRALQRSDAVGAASPVVVLSEGLWRERFGADPSIVGRAVVLDGTAHTVVGIMPRSFEFPAGDVRLWVPLTDGSRSESRSAHYLGVIGRLSTGTSLAVGRATLEAGARRLAEAFPSTNRGWSVTVTTLRDSVVGDVRTPLLLLFSAVACVLLIACANVAGLLLARGITRTREMAVRTALGASAGRLVRQQLVECGALAIAGGLAGVALATWSLRGLQGLEHLSLPLRGPVTLDMRVLLMALSTSIVASLIAGVVPAWRTSREHRHAVQASARSTLGQVTLRNAIVLVQVAVVMILVVAGGLLLRSLHRVTAVDAGFRADRAFLSDIALPSTRYPRDARAALFSRALDGIRALPGVAVAGAGGPLPLAGQEGLLRFGLLIDGRPVPTDRPDRAYLRWATPGYFEAMGIPLRAGRSFAERDAAGAPLVAIIDDVLARRFFGGVDPIGARVRTTSERNWRTVIGVVGHVHQTSLERDAEPHVYVPEAQMPSPALTLVVRGTGDAAALTSGIRSVMRRIDSELPVSNVRTLSDLVAGSVASRRFSTLLLTLFAAVAMGLTLIGVYGVVSQRVSESTREMGIRMALGAHATTVMAGVLGRTFGIAAAGVLCGAVCAWAAVPALSGMLYGVAARDFVTMIGAAALVLAAALLAAYVPARRVLRLDVINALRVE